MTTSDRATYTGYMNGEWVPSSELKIDVFDRGFRVGDAVFDVTRTFNGKSFRLKEHVDRLYRSLNYTRIDPETVRRGDVRAKRRGHPAQ